MPRLTPVPPSEDNAPIVKFIYKFMFGERNPITDPGTATGTPGDWWTAFAISPDILEHAVAGFGIYQSPNRQLDPVLRELGQTRVGYAAQSQFVYSQHCKSLRGLGMPDDKIADIPSWSTSDKFTEVERLVLAYTDCLALELGRVPDAIFEGLRKHLSELEILELTYITTLYLKHAVMSRALRTEYDDVDERITEIRVEGMEDFIMPVMGRRE